MYQVGSSYNKKMNRWRRACCRRPQPPKRHTDRLLCSRGPMTKTTLFPASQRQTHEARSLPHRIKQRPHHDPVFYFDMTLAKDRIDVLSHANFWKCFPTTRGQPIRSSKWWRSIPPEEAFYSKERTLPKVLLALYEDSVPVVKRVLGKEQLLTRRQIHGKTECHQIDLRVQGETQEATERNDQKRCRSSMRDMLWICEAGAYILSMRTYIA